MNQKIIKRLLIIVTLILFLFAIYKVLSIYGVFYSEANGVLNQKQSNWIIKLNDKIVSNGINENFSINEVDFTSSSHVIEGKIAPGLSGSFYITIDPSNTDVAVEYTIKLNSDSENYKNFEISSITEINNNKALTTNDDGSITGIIQLNQVKNNVKDKLKINVIWNNNETYNNEDTILGTTANSSINIPISVDIKQYLG